MTCRLEAKGQEERVTGILEVVMLCLPLQSFSVC